MAGYRLKQLDTGDFWDWVTRNGFSTEGEFWQSLSGLAGGTPLDHMNHYLGTLGYGGSPNDRFRQFLIDQTEFNRSLHDMADRYYNSDLAQAASDGLTTEAGDPLTTEGGDQLFTEGV